jgi:hypothetical protein
MWILMAWLATAAEPRPPAWSGAATLHASFLSGPINAGARADTLDGGWETGRTWNPSLSFGATLRVAVTGRRFGSFALSWTMSRDVAFVDTRDEGFAPGTGGARSTSPIDTAPPVLTWTSPNPKGARITPFGVARYALPLSREMLVCNPSAGAVGLSAGAGAALGSVTSVSLRADVDRALFLHDAPPRGRCGVGAPEHRTLDGVATPGAEGWSMVKNPAWAFEQSVTLTGWHALFSVIPAVRRAGALPRGLTSATLGVRERLHRRADPVEVARLDGADTLPASRTPAVITVPWSVTGGWRVHDHLSAALTLSNQVPGLLFDPAARLRAVPATTSFTLSVTGSW